MANHYIIIYKINMNNIESFRTDIEYDLRSLIKTLEKLRDAINSAIPHVLYKQDIFNEIKNHGLFLINQYRVLQVSVDSKIIEKFTILETNLIIIKNRIWSIINDINANNIMEEY